jgi:hypothetical protein
MGTGGAAGEGSNGVSPFDALEAETGCPLLEPPVRTEAEPDFECPPGCTWIPGTSTIDQNQYFVVCVPDAFLDRTTPGTANEICLTSPVDGIDYLLPNPASAQAAAEMCFIGCFGGPEARDFVDFPELDFDVWVERCGRIWNL